jgi:hypothetical protein
MPPKSGYQTTVEEVQACIAGLMNHVADDISRHDPSPGKIRARGEVDKSGRVKDR